MPFQTLERGVAAIQQGQLDEGARLIQTALQSDQIQGVLRATAYLWLAETLSNPQDKLNCYNQALAADPANEATQQRIALLMAAGLPGAISAQTAPPSHSPSTTPPSGVPGVATGAIYRTVGILGGPNDAGTAFFVTADGLLATTRFVVGGAEQVRCELESGRTVAGQVVRAYPALDLALIHTGLTVNPSRFPEVVGLLADVPLLAYVHNGQSITGAVRDTKSQIRAGWFPTTIEVLVDAGGNPVYDERDQLVGMLTHNSSRASGYFFGLRVDTIYRAVESYKRETSAGRARVYCPGCGSLSPMGGFYCETCGAILPGTVDKARRPQPHLAARYGETARPCPNPQCKSRAGAYNNRCLRCGAEIAD